MSPSLRVVTLFFCVMCLIYKKYLTCIKKRSLLGHAFLSLDGHIIFNSEFKTAALKRAWVPVTTAETIVYARSVKAFSHVKLVTRLVHWNDRRFYLEHIFYVKGDVYAHTYIEGLVRSPTGHLKPKEAFAALGVTRESPPMPEKLQGWVDLIEKK